MSGHNKWSQIKRQKEKTDSQKAKLFGKFGKLLAEEARKSGGNLSAPNLKSAIDRARAANMPSDNIDRAIKKAILDKSASLEAITYEEYGPGGCALMIDALTSNKNKAAQEVKFILSEHGTSLASQGSASWAFTRNNHEWTASTTIPLEDADVEKLNLLVEALEENEEVQAVYTNAE